MTRIYLEGSEITPFPANEPGEFVRLDVTDNTEPERAAILAELKGIMANAIYSRHLCAHDIGKPCTAEPA